VQKEASGRVPVVPLAVLLIAMTMALAVERWETTRLPPPPRRFQVSAWVPYWDRARVRASFAAHAADLNEANFFWYEVQPDGSLHIIDYKTGNMPHETDWTQLRDYALLLSRQSRYPVRRLSYHYLSTGVTESADIGEDDLRRVQWELLATAGEVLREKRFRPRPGPWCGGCDFIPICPKGAALEPRADAEGQLELWRDFWAELGD